MERIKVVLAPKVHETQLLVMQGEHEVLRARLGPPCQVHRMAAPLLLEGLSLWYQRPLSVVLCADEQASCCPVTRSLSNGLGFGDNTLSYVVEVMEPGRHRGRLLGGLGDFRRLRAWCKGEPL
jgi:hypothetical protein